MRKRVGVALFERGAVSLREMAAVGVLSIVIAIVMNAPMVPHMTDAMPEIGFGDPFLTAWMVAWDGHAVIEQPTAPFDSNTFWPWTNSLAFSDALLGYAPAGLVGDGVIAAVTRHNLLYLFSYAFAFFAAYLLARELGVSPIAALVAAGAFAYAPWRLDQRTHLHVLSSGGIPLALLVLARGYLKRKPELVIAGTVVAIWQISIGFTLGIPLGYLLAALVPVGWFIHRRLGTQPLGRPILIASAGGVVLLSVWVLWQALPYYRVVDVHPEARRTAAQVRYYSSSLTGVLAAPPSSYVWGDATAGLREPMRWPTEQALLPGVAAVGLATVGLFSARDRWLRALLGVGTLVCLYLSLGYGVPGGGAVHRLLHDIAPGWEGIRVPGRLMTLTSLGLGCLAALGSQHIIDRGALRRVPGTRGGWALALIPLVVLVEGAGTVDVKKVPLPPAALSEIGGPRLHLPTNDLTDRVYMLWSVADFDPIANGESGFLPRTSIRLRELMPSFPDSETVALLKALHVETVVFHPGMVEFHPSRLPGPGGDRSDRADALEAIRADRFEAMATADLTGLGITREIRDDVLIFHVDGGGSSP